MPIPVNLNYFVNYFVFLCKYCFYLLFLSFRQHFFSIKILLYIKNDVIRQLNGYYFILNNHLIGKSAV